MWVRIADDFPEHPKIVGLSDSAFRLYVSGLCYSGRYLTDGRIPSVIGLRFPEAVAELTRRGLWALADEDEYLIHDWTDYNPDADAVRRRRKAQAERLRRWRDRRDDPPPGDEDDPS